MCVGNWGGGNTLGGAATSVCASREGFMEKPQELIGTPSGRQVQQDGKVAGMLVGLGGKVPVGRMGAGHGKCGCPVGKFELFPVDGRESQTGQSINRRVT